MVVVETEVEIEVGVTGAWRGLVIGERVVETEEAVVVVDLMMWENVE